VAERADLKGAGASVAPTLEEIAAFIGLKMVTAR